MVEKKFRFANVEAWIAECRKITRENDLDNVVLLSGPPGDGKSTLAAQLARQFDNTFNLARVTFGTREFIDAAKSAEKHQAVLADELLTNRRKSMSRENKELVDFLQVCRGLNLHLLICFPHAAMLDREILDHRVRYRIDIELPQGKDGPREAHVKERQIRTFLNAKGEEEYAVRWVPVVPPFRFARNSGVFWEEYLAKKITAARARDEEARGSSEASPGDAEASPRRRVRRVPKQQGRKIVSFRVRETSPLAGILPERTPPESEQRRMPID